VTINTSNVGANATYTATFMTGGRYTLAAYNAASPMTAGAPIPTGVAQPLQAMGPLMIDVVPTAIPATASTAVGPFNDTLIITTNVPMDPTHNITLNEFAQGAVLSFNPMTFTTGGTPGVTTISTINVVNAGNVAASFTLSLGAETPMPTMPAFALNAADAGVLSGTAGAAGTPTATFPAQLEIDPPPLMGAPEGGTGTTFQTSSSLHIDVAPGTVLCASPPNDVTLFVTN
jgi:hypothetical protein